MDHLRDALIKSGFSKEDILFPTSIDDVHVYNLRLPCIPRVIVKARTSQLVSAAVRVANQFDLKVQARSGGHNYANYGLGGVDGHLIVDLKYMDGFNMDRTTWQASVGPGVILKELCQLLHDNGGRVIPHGTCPNVAIGGHATTGGLAALSRKLGLVLDTIVEAEVVTASGDILTTNEQKDPDLFWAIRGASASFAIVTKFVFQTHPEPEQFIEFSFVYALEADIFKKWQSFISQPNLDHNLFTSVYVLPDATVVAGNYIGSEEEFASLKLEEAFYPHALFERTLKHTSWLRYAVDWMDGFNTLPEPVIQMGRGESVHFNVKNVIVKESDPLKDETIDKWFKYIADIPSPTDAWFLFVDQANGYPNTVPFESTAYGHRDSLFVFQVIGAVPQSDDAEEQMYKMTNYLTEMTDIITSSMPNAPWGLYSGYADPTVDKTRYFGGKVYNRLVELKARWDPKNRFAHPQSIGAGLSK